MLKAGFIGFGRMGITHFAILNSHPLVDIVAICDQSSTMRNIIKKYLGIKVFSDYKQMINELDLDFVLISTPSDSHTEIVNIAVEANLHIFVEKPFAMNPSDGQETLGQLNDKNIVNQVGYVNRFNEVFIEIKRILHEGVIGQVKYFKSEMYGSTVLKDPKRGWRGKKKSGGGCLYEFASHGIDLAVYLFGEPQHITGSVLGSIYSSEVEDYVFSSFRYDNGCTGSINVNWSDPTFRKPTNIVSIQGTKGKIIADKHAFKVYLLASDKTSPFQKGWNDIKLTDFAKGVRFYLRGNEFSRQLDYFIDCINNQSTDNISSFAEALKTDIVIDKITKDASSPVFNPSCSAVNFETTHMSAKRPSILRRILNRFKP